MSATRPCNIVKFYIYTDGTHTHTNSDPPILNTPTKWPTKQGFLGFFKVVFWPYEEGIIHPQSIIITVGYIPIWAVTNAIVDWSL